MEAAADFTAWDKAMEGLAMGGSVGGPYGAGGGLVIGLIAGLITADAHYREINNQISTEQQKDQQLEAAIDQLRRDVGDPRLPVIYVQDAGKAVDLSAAKQESQPAPVVKNGDQLMITVHTVSPEASASFNLPLQADPTRSSGQPNRMSSVSALQTYIVDANGEIVFPILGRVKLAGMSKPQVEAAIHDRIYPKYMKEDPMVTVRNLSFKVSVMGEVARPGVVSVSNERISIFEALTQAGDLTIYGKRDNVLLIREDAKGKRETYRLDLTDKGLIQSPYYFLQQNDVVYVQPNKQKARARYFGAGEQMTLSIIGSLVSVASLLIAVLK